MGASFESHTGRHSMSTGTSGTPARRAISKPVRPNGCRPPTGDRVPSGNTRTRNPSASRSSAVAIIGSTAPASVPPPSKCRAADSSGCSHHRRKMLGLTVVTTPSTEPSSAVVSTHEGWFATRTHGPGGSSPAFFRGS